MMVSSREVAVEIEEVFCPSYFKLKAPITNICWAPTMSSSGYKDEKIIQSSCSQGTYILEQLNIQKAILKQ